MTALEKIRTWITTFPGFHVLSEFRVDYTDQVPANGGIFPSGLVEVERREDILGNVVVTNQHNFGIFCVLEKSPGDDVGATMNADWVMDFQLWVQAQLSAVVSIRNKLRKNKKLDDWEQTFYREHRERVDFKQFYSEDELAEQERLKKLLGE